MNDSIEKLLDQGTRHFVWSGYQLYFRYQDREPEYYYGGVSSYEESQSFPITKTSVFDLASLTKVIFGATFFSYCVDRGWIDLTETLDSFLHTNKPYPSSPLNNLTLTQLLSHSSGLIPLVPLFTDTYFLSLLEQKNQVSTEHFIEWLFTRQREELFHEQKNVYSDINFWLLTLVAEKISQQFFQDSLFSSWQYLCKIFFGQPGFFFPSFSSFEYDKKNFGATQYCTLRKQILQGSVFDENAYILESIYGIPWMHAGLFGSAQSVAPLCELWLCALSKKRVSNLSQKTAQHFTERKRDSFCLIWDSPSQPSSSGDFFSLKSFGHLGFTGTSVWVDPVRKGYVIFLTNRVHPTRVDQRIQKIRPLLHNLITKDWV